MLDYDKARITDPALRVRTIAGLRMIGDPSVSPETIVVLPTGNVSGGAFAWRHVGDGIWTATVTPREWDHTSE